MGFSNLSPSEEAALLEGPSLTPPGDIAPNFASPPNRSNLALCLGIASLSFTVPIVLLRIYSRLFCVRLFKLEDSLGLVAFGLYIYIVYVVIDMATHHLGYMIHQWDIPLKDLEPVIRKFLLVIIFYNLTMIFSKAAILLEWVRIFVPFAKRNAFFWTAHILIVANTLLYIAGPILAYLYCIPLEKYWRPWLPGTCIDRTLGDFFSTSLNIIIDFTILILPQHSIWRLNMRQGRKVAISFIFSIGLLGCASAIGRLQSAVHAYTTHDHTYYGAESLLWSLAESTFAILVFHLVSVPKVFDGNGPLSNLIASLWPWKRIPSANVLRSSAKSQSPREWQQSDGDSDISLVQPAYTRSNEIRRDGRIVRTMEFEALSVYDNNVTRSGSVQTHLNGRQHAWTAYNDNTTV
ncbi:hypothetical protein F4680DRAFT_426947 [Xylaria scruposa]|nr:hypothetical protein F4680DRAFT_426947 [Xylaria scruposa]